MDESGNASGRGEKVLLVLLGLGVGLLACWAVFATSFSCPLLVSLLTALVAGLFLGFINPYMLLGGVLGFLLPTLRGCEGLSLFSLALVAGGVIGQSLRARRLRSSK